MYILLVFLFCLIKVDIFRSLLLLIQNFIFSFAMYSSEHTSFTSFILLPRFLAILVPTDPLSQALVQRFFFRFLVYGFAIGISFSARFLF